MRREPLEVLAGELDLERAEVLLEIGDPLGARDRDDVLAAAEDPGQGELGRGDAALARRAPRHASTRLRLRSRFSPWKRGRAAPVVVGGEVVERADLAGEEAAAERRVGDQADAELLARWA